MDLVEEEDRRSPAARGGARAARSITSRTSALAGLDRADSSSNARSAVRGDEPRERRLARARAGRTGSSSAGGPARSRVRSARALAEQVLLADHLVQRARAHARGQRGVWRRHSRAARRFVGSGSNNGVHELSVCRAAWSIVLFAALVLRGRRRRRASSASCSGTSACRRRCWSASTAAAGTGANLRSSAPSRRCTAVDRPHPRGPHQLAAVRLDGAAVDRRRASSAATCSASSMPRRRRCSLFIAAVLLYSAFELLKLAAQAAGARADGVAACESDLDIPAAVATRRRDRPPRRHRRPDPRLAAHAGAAQGRRRDAAARGRDERRRSACCVGVAGALGHLPSGARLDARPSILVGGAASIPGALLGSRLTGRLSEAQLVRAIAVVLLVAGVGMRRPGRSVSAAAGR